MLYNFVTQAEALLLKIVLNTWNKANGHDCTGFSQKFNHLFNLSLAPFIKSPTLLKRMTIFEELYYKVIKRVQLKKGTQQYFLKKFKGSLSKKDLFWS